MTTQDKGAACVQADGRGEPRPYEGNETVASEQWSVIRKASYWGSSLRPAFRLSKFSIVFSTSE